MKHNNSHLKNVKIMSAIEATCMYCFHLPASFALVCCYLEFCILFPLEFKLFSLSETPNHLFQLLWHSSKSWYIIWQFHLPYFCSSRHIDHTYVFALLCSRKNQLANFPKYPFWFFFEIILHLKTNKERIYIFLETSTFPSLNMLYLSVQHNVFSDFSPAK